MRANNLIAALIFSVLISWTSTSALAETGLEQGPGQGTYISGRVSAADDGPITGLVLIEKGRLYGKNFRYGGLIDSDGRFSVKVDGGGGYGLHLYATGYIYFPLSIEVINGQDNRSTYSLPPNPAADEGPIVADVRFKNTGDETLISLSVSDPDDNLSHQVLAVNTATGEGLRLKPPTFVFPWTKNYPEGIYTLKYSLAGKDGKKEVNPENWYFVAADNRCYTSPIMAHPFTQESVLVARTTTTRDGSYSKEEAASVREDPPASGEKVYRNNCSICHYADTTKTKVGPGLKGIFGLKTSPVQGFPVNEENIRNQILKGSAGMPPYGYLSERQVDALIEYLKTL